MRLRSKAEVLKDLDDLLAMHKETVSSAVEGAKRQRDLATDVADPDMKAFLLDSACLLDKTKQLLAPTIQGLRAQLRNIGDLPDDSQIID